MSAVVRLALTLGEPEYLDMNEEWWTSPNKLAANILAADPALAQDIEDGRALRLLREALPDGREVSISRSPDGAGRIRVKTPAAWYSRSTVAEAADACREALVTK